MRRAAALLVALCVACNAILGIEEKNVRDDVEAGTPPPVDAATTSHGDACATDPDCTPPNGCYTAHCDPLLHVCKNVLCEAAGRACSAGTCEGTTCSLARDYGMRATTYDLGVTLGCPGNTASCFAAAYPFVFVGTSDGIAAFRVDDRLGQQSTRVAIAGLSLRGGQIVVSGRRVWFLGQITGAAAPYELAIASLDVPSDPGAALNARQSRVSYPYPSIVGFPAPAGNLFVAYDDPSEGFPNGLVSTSIAETAAFNVVGDAPDAGALPPSPTAPTLTLVRTPTIPAAATLVATSGGRLVAYRLPDIFNLLTAATAGAPIGPDQRLTAAPLAPLHATSGPDGTVLFYGSNTADPPADCNCRSVARIQWALENSTDTAPAGAKIFDFEANVNAQAGGSCHACGTSPYFIGSSLATFVEPRSALVVASGTDPDRTRTAVRLVSRDPVEGLGTRRFLTQPGENGDLAVDRIALASSMGFGYLMLSDPQGANTRLSIVDPGCDAR